MYYNLVQHISFLFAILFNLLISGINVTKITPLKDSGELKCDIHLNDLFDSKDNTKLMSGLPLHLVINIKLTDSKGNQISQNLRKIVVQYDVWDQIFSIRHADYHAQYKSMDSVRSSLKILHRIPVTNLSLINAEEEYSIHIKIHVQNDGSGSVIDSIDHGSTRKGFGLGTIIRFFFGGSEPEIRWYHSDKFKLEEIKSL